MKRVFSAPTTVDLCITMRCNMKCKHCFALSGRGFPEEPTLGRLKYLIDRLNEAKVFMVTLTGGEPLIRPDFFEIVEYIKRYPIRIGLNTNAALVTNEASKKIAAAGFKSRISVSLDGSNKKSFEALRGTGTFEAVIRGIENLLRHNKRIRPFSTVTGHNFRDLENIVKLAKSLGAPCIEFNTLLRGDQAACYEDLFLSPAEKIEALEKMLELNNTYGPYVRGSFVRVAKKAAKLREMPDGELSKLKAKTLQNCNAGFGMAVVSANGKVAPCYAMLDYTVGDLFKDSLKKIWQSSAALWEFRKMHDVSLDDIEPCRNCVYKGMCNAGCRAGAYYASGKTRLDARDPEGCYLFLRENAKKYTNA